MIPRHDIHTWCLFSLYSAKSTELLHSPPVYESDIDTRDHDFYDYAEHPGVQDDDFYYVSWEDPIYDVFEDYDYSGMYLLGFTVGLDSIFVGFITFFIFCSLVKGTKKRKNQLSFSVKCRFVIQKINKKDS